MMAAQTDPRTAARKRVAEYQQAPVEHYVALPWELSIELTHSVWIVRNMKLSPPIYCRIAVDEAERTLWLNRRSDSEELFRFIHEEGLVPRFAHEPERLMEIFLALYTSKDKLLRSLDDIELPDYIGIEKTKGDRERIASLRDQFYAPESISGAPLKLHFWSWSPSGGKVARWYVEIGNGTGDIIYDLVMKYVGSPFPVVRVGSSRSAKVIP